MALVNYALAAKGSTIEGSTPIAYSNNPLTVIDGIPHTNGAWATINRGWIGNGFPSKCIVNFNAERPIKRIEWETLRNEPNDASPISPDENASTYGVTGVNIHYLPPGGDSEEEGDWISLATLTGLTKVTNGISFAEVTAIKIRLTATTGKWEFAPFLEIRGLGEGVVEVITKNTVVDGDSLAEGIPYSDFYDTDKSYPQQLATLLDANYYKYLEAISVDSSRTAVVRNVAQAGQLLGTIATAGTIANEAPSQVDVHATEGQLNITICDALRNDINSGATLAQCKDRMTAYAQARKSAGWQAVMIGTMTPMRDDANEAVRLAYNDFIRANADGDWDYVVDFAADPRLSNPNNTTYFAADGLHLKAAGYLAKAEIVRDCIAQIKTPLQLNFEEFRICEILNITSLGLSMSLLTANFGDGYGAGAMSGKPSGLRKWTIQSNVLPDLNEYSINYELEGETQTATRFDYFWEFYRRHLALGNKPFYFTDPRTQRKFLASFTEIEINFEAITAKLYSGGIPIMQRRVKMEGISFRPEDGSIVE